jgi:hypothetical protein
MDQNRIMIIIAAIIIAAIIAVLALVWIIYPTEVATPPAPPMKTTPAPK